MCAQEKNMERKAVITGMGMVTPLGIGKEENWKNLISGKSGIGPISRFDPKDLSIDIAGEVKDFKASKLIKDRKAVKLSFHSVHLAIVAAQLAMEDSGINVEEVTPSRFGCFIGSGGGAMKMDPDSPIWSNRC